MRVALTSPISLTAEPGEEGVALVITLILLSVITFMAVTFLVVTQSQRGSVVTETERTTAQLAAEAGQERAIADITASILAYSNAFGYQMRVSTNYITATGFLKSGTGYASPTNVAYNYPDGTPLNAADALQNINNLLYEPRVPVYVVTNRTTGAKEFRYYLDLNRNGRYDTNGWLPVMNPTGGFYDTNGNPIQNIIPGNTLSNFYVGDPEWIGLLERPGFPPGLSPPGSGFPRGYPHSGTNRFTSRYAYIVIPIGKTLDLNYVHNYAKLLVPLMNSGDGFRRNQNAGMYEANLASFLVDLNTNMWPYPLDSAYGSHYDYVLDKSTLNRGAAFDDACSLLRYRYDGNFKNLANVAGLFGNAGANAFRGDFIDGYARAPVMGSFGVTDPDTPLVTPVNLSWPGAYNPNHYFTTQELFDKKKTASAVPVGALSFSDRLAIAGAATNSYDRYTFYRMLSQIGTDSELEADKINLNYVNVDNSGRIVPSLATNFTPWTPTQFFTNAANKLLTNAGYTFTVGNIQVWPTNYYTPNVHRLLQLAANIYDSTTNRTFGQPTASNGFPTVFKPRFGRDPNNINIIQVQGYDEVTTVDNILLNKLWAPAGVGIRDLSNTNDRVNLRTADIVSGVPLLIGARKGFPNFNEFSMQTYFFVSRMLEFRRPAGSTTDPVNETNQMYVAAITNIFGVEGWNSYSNPYPRNLQLYVSVDMTASLTNELGNVLLNNQVSRYTNFNLASGNWSGWQNATYADTSFKIPFGQVNNNFMFLTNATYRQAGNRFDPLTHIFDRNTGFDVPEWLLNIRSKVRFLLVDGDANRIVDYVNLDHSEPTIDVMAKLRSDADCHPVTLTSFKNEGSLWCTNRNLGNPRGPTYGVLNQIVACILGDTSWGSFSMDPYAGLEPHKAVDGFRNNLLGFGPLYQEDMGLTFNKSNVFYAPYAPYRPLFIHVKWQANDPLVHYTVGDLLDLTVDETNRVNFTSEQPSPLPNLGGINKRYKPWGGGPAGSSNPTTVDWEYGAKDPLVFRSDDWDFLTSKMANVGWLGAVHRGTPWQTINLKATNVVDVAAWQKWTGNNWLMTNGGQFKTNVVAYNVLTNDASFTLPGNDRYIVDLFTTAFNDNASHGQMSINQDGLAAWSAILGGVIVVTNNFTNSFSDIKPAGVYDPKNGDLLPPLVRIWNGINHTRSNFPNHEFQRLGDILTTPELSIGPGARQVGSPSYWTNASPYLGNTNFMSDAVYERLPRQVLGMLKGAEVPRLVIYAFGQALKPADRSVVVAGGAYYLMPTNYQVMAEVATRTVVRIEGAPTNTHAVIESFNVLPAE